MRAAGGLLRRHRQGQPRSRAEDDQDAGRRVRRGRHLRRADRGVCVSEAASATFGVEAIAMTMRFGDFTALDDVELKVRPGSFHALLGENGAGKTSLVEWIMGYYRSTEGVG